VDKFNAMVRGACSHATHQCQSISSGHPRISTQETADERWRPILGVEQILVSVIAMLNEPNISSPANVDAAVQVRVCGAPQTVTVSTPVFRCRFPLAVPG